MALPESSSEIATSLPRMLDAVAFEAPFVVDKLVKDQVADSLDDAERLFTEAKKFVVLCEATTDAACEMYSVRVDEAWHQFILFTAEYTSFCHRFFGRYVPHSPNTAQAGQDIGGTGSSSMSFADFRSRYENLFSESLPDVWYDVRCITLWRRMIADSDSWSIARQGGVVDLADPAGNVVMSVNDLAVDALEFVLRTGAFYVRELPGGLTDGEKLSLAEALVMSGLVRVAA
jgi:hypothetical protein